MSSATSQRLVPYAFPSPAEVAADPHLGALVKRRLLREWLRDAQAQLVADDDGMRGAGGSRVDEVAAALLAVRSVEPTRKEPA